MCNKLGISESKMEIVESELIKLKLKLLDLNFTFNKDKLDFNYLIKLNNFLFDDIYYSSDIGIRNLDKTEIDIIEIYLDKINKLCIEDNVNIKEILELIKKIWFLQPFKEGNTRTLYAFLKILNDAFSLKFEIDINLNISSSPKMFDVKKYVNQKRLTK